MPHRTAISWCDYSSNPIRARHKVGGETGWACVKVSPGCANCYSEAINGRFGTGGKYTVGAMQSLEMYLDEKELAHMLTFRPRGAFRHGDRPKVFLGDMTDIFGEWVPDSWLDRIFAAMALRPDVDWLLLTKRPERMREYCTPSGLTPVHLRLAQLEIERPRALVQAIRYEAARSNDPEWYVENGQFAVRWPLPNCWLGVSVEDQARAEERIPQLLATPAAVRFLSCEPLLGPVDLRKICLGREPGQLGPHDQYLDAVSGTVTDGMGFERELKHGRIDLVICGGESGPGYRPMDLDWARSLRDQCKAAGVPFFFKQASAARSEQPSGDPDLDGCKEMPGVEV